MTKNFNRSAFSEFYESNDIIDFITCCLDKIPETRHSAEQLLDHRWIKKMCGETGILMSQRTMINVTDNLLKVSKTSEFQSSIIFFLVGFQQSKEQLGRLRRYFDSLDTNQDGVISEAELEALKGKRFGNEFVNSLINESMDIPSLLRSVDTDNDGQITFSEFVTGATERGDLINNEKLKMAFKVIDQDNDGVISTHELMQRFKHSDIEGMAELDVGEDFWKNLIEECDTDKDGQISWEEFRSNMNKLLTLQTDDLILEQAASENETQAATSIEATRTEEENKSSADENNPE